MNGNRMFDVVVVGAGVIGTAIARELALQRPKWAVAVLEKEPGPARHTSGRNSGVVHAGFNQKPGTFKAKLCVEGNRRLRALGAQGKVPLQVLGTLVVAAEQREIAVLEELLKRGQDNGVEGLRLLSGSELRALEPNALGIAALHAPTGGIVDSGALVRRLAAEATEAGVRFFYEHKITSLEETGKGYEAAVYSPSGATRVRSKILINAAGLYADVIARQLGVGAGYAIIPFRGEYYKIRPEKAGCVRSMIYPAPDTRYPFLGVHWTKKIDGGLAVGPNAVLAFGRESYRATDIHVGETLAMVATAPFWRMLGNPEFRQAARRQMAVSLSRRRFFQEAARLVKGCRMDDLIPGSAGNRAQLVNRQGELVDDIVVETRGASVHILNAVSPGMTSSLPFAEHIARTAAAFAA